MSVKHPAQYTPAIVDAMVGRLASVRGTLVDPFAGPGLSLHRFCGPGRRVIGFEIEQPWVDAGGVASLGLVRQGDSTALPLRRNSVAAFFTSPAYGNRFADSHKASERCRACKASGRVDGKRCEKCAGTGKRNHTRRGYTHDIRAMTGDPNYTLHESNSGAMHFGTPAYRDLHRKVYACCLDRAKPGCVFLLNVSDFVRDDEMMRGVLWHLRTMLDVGWEWRDATPIVTPRMRYGKNAEKRADLEWILEFRRAPDEAKR